MCVEHNVLAKLKRKLMMQRRYFCFRNQIHTYTYTANHTIALPTPMHTRLHDGTRIPTGTHVSNFVSIFWVFLRFVEVPLLIVEKVWVYELYVGYTYSPRIVWLG